jgi:type IV pilus assembly protein PilC
MASFAYTAINAQGVEIGGTIVAGDVSAAREQLRVKGLLARSLSQVDDGDGIGQTSFSFGSPVKPKALQIFSRQFATMIEAGLNVVSALAILEDQTDDQGLAKVITELRKDVEGGEAAGILDIVLDRVAFQIEKQEAIRRRVKGAMIYPTMVLIFATLVLIGMLMFLVPVFVKIFSQLGGQLPTLTQYVVMVSNVIRSYWFIIIPGLISLPFIFKKWKATEKGRQTWDKFILKLPMKIGDTVLKVTMARFSRTLSTLVASGVDIIKALEITGQTAGNWVVEEALAGVRARVHEGVPIAQPLIENEVFPPMVAQMVKIGEETGELEKMLAKIADFYEDEVDASVGALTSIVEPVMMLGVGLMVGVIIISMYLPMFKMLTLVK